jgi:hypothetical protein
MKVMATVTVLIVPQTFIMSLAISLKPATERYNII